MGIDIHWILESFHGNLNIEVVAVILDVTHVSYFDRQKNISIRPSQLLQGNCHSKLTLRTCTYLMKFEIMKYALSCDIAAPAVFDKVCFQYTQYADNGTPSHFWYRPIIWNVVAPNGVRSSYSSVFFKMLDIGCTEETTNDCWLPVRTSTDDERDFPATTFQLLCTHRQTYRQMDMLTCCRILIPSR